MNPVPAFGIIGFIYAVFMIVLAVLAVLAVYALVLAIIFLRLRIAELKRTAPGTGAPE
jgi:uncharacterized membrane protein